MYANETSASDSSTHLSGNYVSEGHDDHRGESQPLFTEVSCRKALSELERTYPDWFAAYDAIGGDYAPIDQLGEALKTAPHTLLAMMVFTAINFRRQVAAITARHLQSHTFATND